MSARVAKVFEEAIAKVSALPTVDQESIGRDLLAHIEALEKLRSELDPALSSLDRGEGREIDMEDVIRRARQKHAGS